MISVLTAYNKLQGLPLGKYIFSKAVCLMAPYFKTIRPRFAELRPGYGRITMKNRRAVRNHLNSVHAVAMCNLCELAGGTTLEVTLPPHLRWIPSSMEVEYLRIAKTDLTGTCVITAESIKGKGALPVRVSVTDTKGTEVMKATINMHITERNK